MNKQIVRKTNSDEKFLILIVDDSPNILQELGNILMRRDLKIAMAPSGGQALAMMENLMPDLVLLDILMPDMDGFTVCKKMKASTSLKEIPVIFLTAKSDPEDIVKGIHAGAVDYISKPFNKAELLARVDTQLQLRHAQKENLKLGQRNAALAMAVTANHEINQPLTILQGNYDLLQKAVGDNRLSEKEKMHLDKMGESILKIKDILNKFNEAASIHFEEYLDGRNMVVFDDNNSYLAEERD